MTNGFLCGQSPPTGQFARNPEISQKEKSSSWEPKKQQKSMNIAFILNTISFIPSSASFLPSFAWQPRNTKCFRSLSCYHYLSQHGNDNPILTTDVPASHQQDDVLIMFFLIFLRFYFKGRVTGRDTSQLSPVVAEAKTLELSFTACPASEAKQLELNMRCWSCR